MAGRSETSPLPNYFRQHVSRARASRTRAALMTLVFDARHILQKMHYRIVKISAEQLNETIFIIGPSAFHQARRCALSAACNTRPPRASNGRQLPAEGFIVVSLRHADARELLSSCHWPYYIARSVFTFHQHTIYESCRVAAAGTIHQPYSPTRRRPRPVRSPLGGMRRAYARARSEHMSIGTANMGARCHQRGCAMTRYRQCSLRKERPSGGLRFGAARLVGVISLRSTGFRATVNTRRRFIADIDGTGNTARTYMGAATTLCPRPVGHFSARHAAHAAIYRAKLELGH